MNNIPNELFDVILQKGYHELNDDEKSLVSKYFTPEDYEATRQSMLSFKAFDQGLDYKMSSLEINQAPPRSVFRKIVEYKLPLYQVAAGLALLCMVSSAYDHKWLVEGDESTSGQAITSVGKSLAEDDYPKALVFVE